MSISSELTALNGHILSAYGAVDDKGGTVPANKNMANLASSIATISGGGGGGVGITRSVDSNGVFGYPTEDFTFQTPATATNLGQSALYYAFDHCTTITNFDLSSITTVSGGSACYSVCNSASNLTTVNLSSIESISGTSAFYQAFNNCAKLTSVDMSSLETVSKNNVCAYMFNNCPNLASINFSSLTSIPSDVSAFSYAFNGCHSLTSISFPALATLTASQPFYRAFRYCASLTSVSFPSLTPTSFGSSSNQFNNMLDGVQNCTVHFPAAIQSTIGSWSSVTSGFGGTNTTVLYDL